MSQDSQPKDRTTAVPNTALPEIRIDSVGDNEKDSLLDFLVENEVRVGSQS